MTNYVVSLAAAAALLAGTGSPAVAPAPAATPVAAPAARVAAAPAGTRALPHYAQSGAGSLVFHCMQAGAENHGSFTQFSTELSWDEKKPAAGALEVTVQTGSIDTQDKD